MKTILTILLLAISSIAGAQTKKDTICDKLYSIKKINNTFYLLNIGGRYPNQKYTVVLKGSQDADELYNLIDSQICITGKKQIYKGKTEIVISGRFINLRHYFINR